MDNTIKRTDVSDKLCDLAVKLETVKAQKEELESFITYQNAIKAIYVNLQDWVDYVGWYDLSVIHKEIVMNLYDDLMKELKNNKFLKRASLGIDTHRGLKRFDNLIQEFKDERKAMLGSGWYL